MSSLEAEAASPTTPTPSNVSRSILQDLSPSASESKPAMEEDPAAKADDGGGAAEEQEVEGVKEEEEEEHQDEKKANEAEAGEHPNQSPSPPSHTSTAPFSLPLAALPSPTLPSPFDATKFLPLHTPKAPSTSSAALESLLSPGGTPQADVQMFPRDSVAESELSDVGLNDERFSTVSLNARDSTTAIKSPVDRSAPPPWARDDGRMTPVSFDGSDQQSTNIKTHKKTASTASARASFLLHRLEHQKEEKGSRSSLDGQHHIQEEFNRLHHEIPEQENGVGANGIDWDFWGAVVSDYQTFAAANPDKLAREIEGGIPDTLRGMVWQLMSASKDPEMERSYLQLLKESSPHEKAIMRDLGRTFPHHAFFTDGQGIGQENLFNVLKAYSLYDPQVGYCQGLPFIVAVLLLNMPDEEAFCLLVRLMHSYGLRGHFLPEMPKLQLRLFQFDRLIEELLPVLNLHFVRQGVKSSMFCSQWFLTLFSYRFPLELVFRIFDNCLASGIEAIFGFSLALLQKNEEKIRSLKFDELVAFLNQHIIDAYKDPVDPSDPDAKPTYRVDDLVQDAINLRITPFMLDAYAHEYAEMIRERDAHAMEVDFLRSSNRNLSSQVNALEASLAQLNQDHVNVLNELVRARLRHEELEGELVRYKLLYAESVHKTEDAMSSHRMSNSSSFGGSLFGTSPSSKRPSLQSMISGLTKSSS